MVTSPARIVGNNRARWPATIAMDAPTIEPIPSAAFRKPTPASPVCRTSIASTMRVVSIIPSISMPEPASATSKRRRSSCTTYPNPAQRSAAWNSSSGSSETASFVSCVLQTAIAPPSVRIAKVTNASPGPEIDRVVANANTIPARSGPRKMHMLSIRPMAA